MGTVGAERRMGGGWYINRATDAGLAPPRTVNTRVAPHAARGVCAVRGRRSDGGV